MGLCCLSKAPQRSGASGLQHAASHGRFLGCGQRKGHGGEAVRWAAAEGRMLLTLLLTASFMHTHCVDALCAASAWRLPTWPTKQLRPAGKQLLHAASQLTRGGLGAAAVDAGGGVLVAGALPCVAAVVHHLCRRAACSSYRIRSRAGTLTLQLLLLKLHCAAPNNVPRRWQQWQQQQQRWWRWQR